MGYVDKNKYWSSIFFVFAVGALLTLAIDQHIWSGVTTWNDLWTKIVKIQSNTQGIREIWKFLSSGSVFATTYILLFEKFLWRIPFLQDWLVRFPNLEGTWVGVLIPRTAAMRPSNAEELEVSQSPGVNAAKPLIPDWAIKEGVLPVHVTIKHEFEKLTYRAIHPNSVNETLAQQLVYLDQSKQIHLYVIYHNVPNKELATNAAEHNGCCQLRLVNNGRTKFATQDWELRGIYWTDKAKSKEFPQDKGTWGDFHVRWESRRLGEPKVDFNKRERFC